MQIHEVTKKTLDEGFIGDLKKVGQAMSPSKSMAGGFVQGVTGAHIPASDATTAKQAQATVPQTTPTKQTRIVVSVSQPGQDQPAKYYKVGNRWTNELGQSITGAKQIAYLDKLIATHGTRENVPVTPVEPARSVKRKFRSKS